jgi:AcrR family transcriptional regulator
MPREADHDQRRRQIAAAVWRLAGRGGLEDVTLRQVAAEAGVSARLLQYYFGTRQQLLLGALTILNADAEEQARTRLAALGDRPRSRDLVRGILLELLPLDDERRAHHLVHAVYFIRFLTDPDLRAVARDAEPAVEDLVAALILGAQQAGDVPAHVRPDLEAELLVAAASGLQASLLLGQTSPERAAALLEHQLDRVFLPG